MLRTRLQRCIAVGLACSAGCVGAHAHTETSVLRGRIVDALGHPVRAAQVTALPAAIPWNPLLAVFAAGRGIPLVATRTDGSGGFELEIRDSGEFQLRIEHPGYCLDSGRRATVTRGRTTSLDSITLAAGCRVTGVVRRDRTPVPRARVTIDGDDDSQSISCLCDAAGCFVSPRALPPGEYRMLATDPDDGVIIRSPILHTVRLRIASGQKHVELVLGPAW